MKFTINNFGAIKRESNICVNSKLNLFCGPNGTGKTYISYLLYGLGKLDPKSYINNSSCELLFKTNNLSLVPENESQEVKDKIERLSTKDNFNFIPQFKKTISFDIQMVSDIINQIINNYKKNSFHSLFGLGKHDVERLFDKTELNITLNKSFVDKFKEKYKGSITIDSNNKILVLKKEGDSSICLYLKNENESHSLYQSVGRNIIEFYWDTFVDFNTYLLPVERNSIYTFSKELSLKRQDTIDKIQDLFGDEESQNPFDLLNRRLTRYPMAVRDGLTVSEDLFNFSKVETEYVSFAEKLEKDILDGKVVITKENEIIFTSNKGAKKNAVPIQSSASLIKSLSGMVFYLKHLAQRGDMLIIDEPEMNLHPDHQRSIAKILVRLVNAGLKLTVSTHSDYIIREINNLIMLSSEKEEVKKIAEENGYGEDEKIKPNDIKVNYFYFDTKTMAKVKPLEVTSEGFDIDSIDRTIEELNDTTDELLTALNGLD
ncbi:AAA family ATPase [Flammeovirga sp. SubArs3]|uniref:AAA family ATPase n=1 Tax=Flammeovirga sp. SubArs3 TaxID=2995316 RepID=UPI00248C3CAC|nr:AAA family ATPase [Flammeovirga sp. SubArs3]